MNRYFCEKNPRRHPQGAIGIKNIVIGDGNGKNEVRLMCNNCHVSWEIASVFKVGKLNESSSE